VGKNSMARQAPEAETNISLAGYHHQKGKTDLVTEADFAAEKLSST
jgi:hypothetical protein